MKTDVPIKTYFKRNENQNNIKVELYNVIKANICHKKTLWLPYTAELKRIENVRDQISFQDVMGINDKLRQNDFMDSLLFTFNKRIILEDIDISKLIPAGIFQNKHINVSVKAFVNMQADFVCRNKLMLYDMMLNIYSVQEVQ